MHKPLITKPKTTTTYPFHHENTFDELCTSPRFANSMPGPAVFAVPASVLALKRLALQASVYYTPEVASATTMAAIATVLAKFIWRYIPEWIKQDISFRTLFLSKHRNGDDETREELTHLSSIIQSVHRFTKSMEEGVHVPQLHAAVLAYIQWSRQMKQEQLVAEVVPRDLGYETAGHSVDLKQTLRTQQHQDSLEFATLAYHGDSEKLRRNLQSRDYELVIHDASDRPGFVAFYVAVSGVHKQVVVGVRGTSSLEDLVTDCCGHAVPLKHYDPSYEERGSIEVEAEKPHEIRLSKNWSGEDAPPAIEVDHFFFEDEGRHFDQVEIVSGHERIHVEHEDGDYHVRCHEGILFSSQRLCRRVQALIKTWAVDAGYQVVICGHSLGAGVATLSGLILRAHYPAIKDQLHVYAFAPPPVLDHDSALASASFVTSFVHNADLIPRCSLFNLAILLQGLRLIHDRLDEHGMNPTGPQTTAAFVKHLFGSSRRRGSDSSSNSSISNSGKCDGQLDSDDILLESDENESPDDRDDSRIFATAAPLITLEEWQEATEAGTPDIRKSEHLFVAGRVLLVYSPWSEEREKSDELLSNTPSSPKLRCIETDGTSPALRGLEADSPRVFTDHVTSAYFDALGIEYHFD